MVVYLVSYGKTSRLEHPQVREFLRSSLGLISALPADSAVGCGETQEIALVGALDHQANYDSVIFDNDVLFRRSYVRQTAHNRCK